MNEVQTAGGASNSASTVTKALTSLQDREYYVDAGEAAKFLGIHRRTALQMARDAVLPPLIPWEKEDENFGDSCYRNWTNGCAVE
jgi:hypothetical protein